MKIQTGAVLLALALAPALGGCMGPEGNPNGQPYANEEGGAIASQPQTVGQVAYDPYGKAAPFSDMTAGGAAIQPSATPPLNMTTQGQAPAPAGALPPR